MFAALHLALQNENGSAPADQCDLQPSEPVNTTYKLTLFNGDPRFKLCLAYEYLRGNATVVDFTNVIDTNPRVG